MSIRLLRRLRGLARLRRDRLTREKIERVSIESKYVAFVDVLGFSRFTLDGFQETIDAYSRAFTRCAHFEEDYPGASIRIYSDAVMITASKLRHVVQGAQLVSWAMLLENYLVRGGIAYGQHKEIDVRGSLCVVSEPLTRAVQLEKQVKFPCIAIDPSVAIPDEWWIPYPNPFGRPILHYRGINMVSPFSLIWGQSARLRASLLKQKYPEHSEKYDWIIDLYDACYNNQLLVPEFIKEKWRQVRQELSERQ